MNEEIEDGYLRFIRTKEDFIALLQPADILEDWEKIFKMRKVDLDHPLSIEFFKFLKEYINQNE